jgi:hypothetical protein
MAGILTLDSGNVLSHSQLLAANLGIPNATVPSALLPVLREKRDHDLFYAVTRGGVVVLKEKDSLAPEEIGLWAEKTVSNKPRVAIDASKLRLSDPSLIPLTELTAQDSGAQQDPGLKPGAAIAFFECCSGPGCSVWNLLRAHSPFRRRRAAAR